ncbi:MAG: hypothetical protein AB1503_04950 [Bacillota bacterium]|nr:hypothetical protein [Bacillota bacterium]
MQRGSRSRNRIRHGRLRGWRVVHRAGGQLVIVRWLVRSRYGVVGVVQKVDY